MLSRMAALEPTYPLRFLSGHWKKPCRTVMRWKTCSRLNSTVNHTIEPSGQWERGSLQVAVNPGRHIGDGAFVRYLALCRLIDVIGNLWKCIGRKTRGPGP